MAAGCTSVIKPSEETPLTALALAMIAEEAGIPAGVLNILPCSREMTPVIGDLLCRSFAVRKISCTGSTATGKLLFNKSADTMKRLSFELGGNAPFIVFDSADFENLISFALSAKLRANGQACIAADRFLIQKGIHERFVSEMEKAVNNLKLGDPFGEEADVSCLINNEAIKKVETHVSDAIKQGGRPIIGCERHPLGQNFFKPSIIDGCNENMACMREETFGPLISVMTFETEEEAINIANRSKSGFAGYLFSQDVAQIFRVSERLEVGMVSVNSCPIASDSTPFSGMKESGLGIEGSKYGIDEYLQTKLVCLGGL